MDIGVLVTATAESGDLAAVARRAEELGFASLWIPEHPVIPVGHSTPFPGAADGALPDHYNRWSDPFIALTVAAGVTNRIKLGTGISLLPERDPLITAKVIASLDLYSNGRVILGIGAGWLREETEIMGTTFRLRWKRLRETVEAMRLLWTQREASYEGELIQFPAVRCEPKPVQKNGPQVLLGAHGPKAIERVARSYDGWFPLVQSPQALGAEIEALRKLVKEAGRDPASVPVTPIVDPENGDLSADTLKQYQAAGVSGMVVFNQKMGTEIADGKAHEWLDRVAPIVERAESV
jgi:probable F420-dependent oxidoreductase